MQPERIPTIDITKLYESGQEDVLVMRFADYLHKHHKNLAMAHRHNFYHLVYFTSGAGSHTIDFTKFTLVADQIYFMIPGQVHSWAFEGEVDGFVVNFTESYFKTFLLNSDYLANFTFFNGVATDNVINVPVEPAGDIKVIFEKILCQKVEDELYKDMVRVLLLELFILTERTTLTARTERIPPHNYTVIRNFQKLVEENYLTLRLPREYADLLSVTPNHLNAVCKSYLGMQAGELIRNRIILESKRLLVNLNLNIGQVGYELNFSDNSYFTKFFKKHTGLTPEEFRMQHV